MGKKMGWETTRFLDKDTIIDCLICKKCITQWLQGGQNSCPVDRERVTLAGLKTPNRITMQLLSNLIIRCKNYSERCTLMSKLENMPSLIEHENQGCKYTENNEANIARKEINAL